MAAEDQRRRNSNVVLKDFEDLSKDVSSSSPKARLELEMHEVHIKRFLADFEFFKRLAPRVRERLPSLLHRAPDRKKGDVIFFEDAAPDNAYIILSGSVGVYKKDVQDEARDAEDESKQEENAASEDSTRCPSARSSSSSSEESRRPSTVPSTLPSTTRPASTLLARPRPTDQESSSPWGTWLATLPQGSLFGELALLKDTVRSATIVCEEDCVFLVIERADFEAVLKDAMGKEREEKMQFIRSHVPGFRRLPENKRNKVFYRFEDKSFLKGYTFAVEGHLATSQVFLLVDGVVEVRRASAHVEGEGKQGEQGSQVVSAIIPGSLFGSVYTGHHEKFTIVAKTQVSVLCMDEFSINRMPLTLCDRMDKYFREVETLRLQRWTSNSERLSLNVSSGMDHNLPRVKQTPMQRCNSQPDSLTSRLPMTKLAASAAKGRNRMRGSSSTGFRSHIASKDRLALVNSGFLQVSDLVLEAKKAANKPLQARRQSCPSLFA